MNREVPAHRVSPSCLGRRQRGAMLMEMLALLVPTAVLAAGAIGFFSLQNRTQVQQDLAVAMEENLRAAMTVVTDKLRAAGCGAPSSGLGDWVHWVEGFGDDPIVIQTGAFGDEISIAACTPQPVATITAVADAGATTLSIATNYPTFGIGALFNTSDKSLILIGDRQNAIITAVVGNELTIDTDPTAMWNQGLPRAYLPGTPISRIDVSTFRVAVDGSGLPGLEVYKHGEASPARSAEGVVDLRLLPVDAPRQYQVVLSARSQRADPLTGNLLTRSLASNVHLRN